MIFRSGDLPSADSPFRGERVLIDVVGPDTSPHRVADEEAAVQALIDADPDFHTLSPDDMADRLQAFYKQVGSDYIVE